MKSIAVIGQGFVGGALTNVFSERNFTVYCYDKYGNYSSKSWKSELGKKPTSISDLTSIAESDIKFTNIYFVCLPTPMFEDGSADLSIVEGVLKELSEAPTNRSRIAVVKSTVPPGSTEKWNKMFEHSGLKVVFNPEFLREASALDDMRNQSRIILGGPRPFINKVKHVFQSAFPNVPVIKTSSTNAEMVKYITNCFLATKISFANEMYQLCNALDEKGLNVDYDRVVECATMDPRLGNSHWKVPSFETGDNGEPLMGFSLSCFPKDLRALIHKEIEYGLKPTVLNAVWEKNLEVRPQKDWEKMLGRAVSKKE